MARVGDVLIQPIVSGNSVEGVVLVDTVTMEEVSIPIESVPSVIGAMVYIHMEDESGMVLVQDEDEAVLEGVLV